MTKEQAIEAFFLYNQIDKEHISRYLDKKLEYLPEKVDKWLSIVDPDDQDFFLRMLSQYTYLTNEASVRRYDEDVTLLENKLEALGLSLSDTLFISTASSDGRKSGSDHVRSDLHRLCADRVDARQILLSAYRPSEEELADYKAFAFVDDIIGTGFTLWGTIRSFLEAFPSISGFPLFVLCTVPTNRGISHLSKEAKKKGISIDLIFKREWIAIPAFDHPGLFDPSERTDAIERVRKYEILIDSYMKEPGRSYIFGFWGCKQLVSFYYNTPNNTLRTFWRWTDTHMPLFPREKQAQVSLKDIQSVKKKKDLYAYRIRRENRRRRNETT